MTCVETDAGRTQEREDGHGRLAGRARTREILGIY